MLLSSPFLMAQRCAADDALRMAADPLSTARTNRDNTLLFAVGGHFVLSGSATKHCCWTLELLTYRPVMAQR